MADATFVLVVARADGTATSRSIAGYRAARTFAHNQVDRHGNTVLVYEEGELVAVLIPDHVKLQGRRWAGE